MIRDILGTVAFALATFAFVVLVSGLAVVLPSPWGGLFAVLAVGAFAVSAFSAL